MRHDLSAVTDDDRACRELGPARGLGAVGAEQELEGTEQVVRPGEAHTGDFLGDTIIGKAPGVTCLHGCDGLAVMSQARDAWLERDAPCRS